MVGDGEIPQQELLRATFQQFVSRLPDHEQQMMNTIELFTYKGQAHVTYM